LFAGGRGRIARANHVVPSSASPARTSIRSVRSGTDLGHALGVAVCTETTRAAAARIASKTLKIDDIVILGRTLSHHSLPTAVSGPIQDIKAQGRDARESMQVLVDTGSFSGHLRHARIEHRYHEGVVQCVV
jgi:hypothetical protein